MGGAEGGAGGSGERGGAGRGGAGRGGSGEGGGGVVAGQKKRERGAGRLGVVDFNAEHLRECVTLTSIPVS